MSQLFLYKIVFITELLIAEFLFSFRFNKRKNFVLRLIIGIVISYLVAIFYPLISYTGWYSSLMFFILFIISLSEIIQYL